MIKAKIGQEIILEGEYTLKSLFGNSKTIKNGDRAFIDSNGGLHYISGEARGLIELTNSKYQLKGYDHANISKLIYNRLKGLLPMEELADEYTSESEVLEEIEDILSLVL